MSSEDITLNYTVNQVQKPFITVSYDKTNGWYATQQIDYNFMAGSIKVNFTSDINNNDFYIQKGDDNINGWSHIVDFFSSFNNLQPLVIKYLYTSTIVNIIFQDFINQLYNSNSDQLSDPLQQLRENGDENFLDHVQDNVNEYAKELAGLVCELQKNKTMISIYKKDDVTNPSWQLQQELINGILIQGDGSNQLQAYNSNWTKSSVAAKYQLIHAPLCVNDENGPSLTFTVPYETYKSFGNDQGNKTLELLVKLLQDQNITYSSGQSENKASDPTISFDQNSILYLVYEIGNHDDNIISKLNASFADIDSPGNLNYSSRASTDNPGEFQAGNQLPSSTNPLPGYNTSDTVGYIPFVAGVRYTVKITKWSPMLLIYFKMQNVSLGQDPTSCKQYLTDTNSYTTINECASSLDDDTLKKLCTTVMDFGTHGDNYDIPAIKQDLIVSDNERCGCFDARIAPYNQKNTDSGRYANLCFNKVCGDDPNFRKEQINKLLGGEDSCKKYCDVVAGWLKDGLNMEHANEIDSNLFKKICGTDFSPDRPFLNNNVLISSIIVSVLLLILFGFICKLRNFSLVKSNIIILCLMVLFGGVSFALAWECSGQTFLYGPLGGPYENKCKSRNLKINLPMDFCPKDLGSECEVDSDCKKTGCNNNCIAQICTPGENQERVPIVEHKKYFPVSLSILCFIIMIISVVILILYFKLYNTNKWYKIAIFTSIIILCIIIPIITGLKGKNITKLPPNCTTKPNDNKYLHHDNI